MENKFAEFFLETLPNWSNHGFLREYEQFSRSLPTFYGNKKIIEN